MNVTCGPVTRGCTLSYSPPSSVSSQDERTTKALEKLLFALVCVKKWIHVLQIVDGGRHKGALPRFPFQKKTLPTSMESGLCTAPAISVFKVASTAQLGLPILGIAPGKCLSNTK